MRGVSCIDAQLDVELRLSIKVHAFSGWDGNGTPEWIRDGPSGMRRGPLSRFQILLPKQARVMGMNSRLNRIQDWEKLARDSGYSTKRLASTCQVSPRQLQRFFLETWQISPRHWLTRVRQRRALDLLQRVGSVKEISWQLGYKTTAHFSREFKRHHGICPTRIHLVLPFSSQNRLQNLQ